MSDSARSIEWVVWHPEGGEDGPEHGREIMAVSARHAAEKYARLTDSEDDAEDRTTWTFRVLNPRTKEVGPFIVTKMIESSYSGWPAVAT